MINNNNPVCDISTYNKFEWQQRIRNEFGIPAKQVIMSYANSGYSKRLTAGALDITTQTLLSYCRRDNIQFSNRDGMREECKPKPGMSAKGQIRNPWGRRGKP